MTALLSAYRYDATYDTHANGGDSYVGQSQWYRIEKEKVESLLVENVERTLVRKLVSAAD